MTTTAPARPALLRTLNDRTVLALLVTWGPSSRADLALRSGLSKPTVAEVLSRLEAAALVVDAGETVGRRGPNGRLYDLAVELHRGAALTVEPGRLTAEIVDVRGRVLSHATRPRAELPEGAGAATRELVTQAARSASLALRSVSEIVIALPGSYDPVRDQVRHADRIPDWTVRGLASSIRAAFDGDVAITLDNDVNLALVAERTAGASRGSAVSSLLWLSHGVGLATDLGGTLYRGVTGGAGEIGYIPVPAATPDGRGLAGHADFQDLVGASAVLRLARHHGITGRSAGEAVRRAAASYRTDEAASAFVEELARRISLGLIVIVAVLDPGLVVLGGAIGRAGGAVLADATSATLSSLSPLTVAVVASEVEGDPCLAGARASAASRARDRLLAAVEEAR